MYRVANYDVSDNNNFFLQRIHLESKKFFFRFLLNYIKYSILFHAFFVIYNKKSHSNYCFKSANKAMN